MQTNIIDYFHKTGNSFHQHTPSSQRACLTSLPKQVRHMAHTDSLSISRNDKEVITLMQDSKFKERLLNQIKYKNNLRPNQYSQNTHNYLVSQ